MTEPFDPMQLHAYVDGELAADEVAAIDRALAADPAAAAAVSALRAQKNAMHARYDDLLAAPHRLSANASPRFGGAAFAALSTSRAWAGSSIAAAIVLAVALGAAGGWIARGRVAGPAPVAVADARGDYVPRFVRAAAVSHAVFVPEVRHPVEVAAADEAHLVQWLSKRLDAPLVVPHLGDAGWSLLGGRLLPADVGPVAQFMYQDAQGRRLTLAISHPRRAVDAADPARSGAAFRIAEENGNTVFYWLDAGFAYALTGKLARAEMTDLAGRVYRALERAPEKAPG